MPVRITVLPSDEVQLHNPARLSLLISVSEPGQVIRPDDRRYRHILLLAFSDVEAQAAAAGPAGRLFSPGDARATRDFLQEHGGEAEELIVCCATGHSRSPALALAIAEWLSPTWVDRLRTHYPAHNRWVYEVLREDLEDRRLVKARSWTKRLRLAFRG